MPTIVVTGSLNMDFVVRVEHLPVAGETVLGSDFQTIPGGKGANQACAAGKAAGVGVLTRMVGRVGYDVFADQLKASLAAAGVDVSYVHATRSQPTGVALIWVDRAGQNSIIVASGANHMLLAAEIENVRGAYRESSYALFQLETPLDTVTAAMAMARNEGAKTILDPAPAQSLPRELLAMVDLLTPNETEALMLLGQPASRLSVHEAPQVASALLDLGPAAVILKLGDQGAFYFDRGQSIHISGFKVEACDTTAAGDTFNGALAVALAEGKPMEHALRFANAAAAISVTRMGAQASIPSRKQIDEFLKSQTGAL
jgi:ribokinase